MEIDRILKELEERVPPTLGQKLAERVAVVVGSWWFIAAQTIFLVSWVALNTMKVFDWDLYPFILMNLFLSLQAAYTAPMILMSQNRQNEKDRRILYSDFEMDRETHTRMKNIEIKLDELLDRTSKLER